MPAPIKVQWLPHDPQWALAAAAEGQVVADALGQTLLTVHHIGSTAIPGIRAKPILDLMPVVTDQGALDQLRPRLEALGYDWRGPYGLPGRRKVVAHPEIPSVPHAIAESTPRLVIYPVVFQST